MDTIEAEEQVATGTWADGRARVSAPRTMVRHVEVLVMEQQLALLILGDLDPYPPTITRRASPPPDVRRARYSAKHLTHFLFVGAELSQISGELISLLLIAPINRKWLFCGIALISGTIK
ncbi:hypothetical protein AB0X98_11875 [Rothia koreensis]|uniref:hypothetical protein n=1 Tax=Rothia koreensis TaxID=592378 RepID=UPI003F25AE00